MGRRLVAWFVAGCSTFVACTAAPPPRSSPTPAPATATSSAEATAGATATALGAPSAAPIAIATATVDPPSAAASASASVETVAAPRGIPIEAGTRVFLFGDSMVNAGLGQRLQRLVADRGGTYAENHWSSSTTKKWSESERLPNLLVKHKPDVVFIALGSNEVYFLDKHAADHVQAIVKKLAGRPCVWIGPPVWKTQTGIVDAERDNASPCAFFDSSTVELERQKDGIHPSLKGGTTWADAVWSATVAPTK